MFEFYMALKAHLEANNSLFAKVALNGLNTATASISIGSMPSPLGTRYYDNSRIRVVQFQVLVKNPSPEIAMNASENINDYLDGATFEVEGYKVNSCEVYVDPSWLEKTNASEHIYTAAYRAEIIKE